MRRAFFRPLYRSLLHVHPRAFRSRFADEMLWIYDEVCAQPDVSWRDLLGLFGDAVISVGRQWMVGSAAADELAWTATPRELFAWDRIAYPEVRLPLARMIQGGFVSIVLISLLSATALTASGRHALFAGIGTQGGRVPEQGNSEMPQPPVSAGTEYTAYVQVRADTSEPVTASNDSSPARPWAAYPVVATDRELPNSELVPETLPADQVQLVEAPTPAQAPIQHEDGVFLVTPSASRSATPPRMLTAQYDNARTGANLSEKILTPANVSSSRFGKLFTLKVDGDVYAQPLYLPDVEVPGKGKHNVLFVATENDSVYAFDADGASSEPLWHAALADSKDGATPLSDRDTRCFFIVPKVGITSTPVIDLPSGTLYALARTKEGRTFKQRLHALAITTGAEKLGGPVEITASVKGFGRGGSGGQVSFDPLAENQRAALLLANDSIYVAWGSSCDIETYHGWLIAYDAHTLAQQAAFNTSPDAADSAIWQGDAGPAADKAGSVFVVTGNGEFDAATGGRDYGDSVLKLKLSGSSLALSDFFTPSNQQQLNARDDDLGSSGVVLLPDQPGPHPHLLVTGGKEGKLYLIDRDQMGKFQPGDDPHAVQTISASRGAYGAMAYWNQNVFFIGSEAALEDFSISAGQLKLKATGNSKFLDSGATPVVSANGTENGIVWAASSKNWNEPPGRPAVLHAFDGTDVTRELYTTEQNAARDRAGVALRFAMPTVINGKVYLGTKGQVDVYGLLPQH